MDIIEALIHKIGYLTYTLPSAFVVLLAREWTRISFLRRYMLSDQKTTYSGLLASIDPYALFCLSLTNISWGGMLQKNRKDYWLGFLISQFSLLVLTFILIIYLKLKDPLAESYLYLFCHSIIKQSWLVMIINFIPIPPFDMSFFYMQKPFFGVVQTISKIVVGVSLIGGFFDIAHFIPGFLF